MLSPDPGIVQECPEHVRGCKPGEYISRDRWGRVGGLTHTEQRTHFAFWCMLSAPLILGNDPRHMTSTTLDILRAPEIIALSQDPLAKQARKVVGGGVGGRGGLQLFRDINATCFVMNWPDSDRTSRCGLMRRQRCGSSRWRTAGLPPLSSTGVKEQGMSSSSLPVTCPSWLQSGRGTSGPRVTARTRTRRAARSGPRRGNAIRTQVRPQVFKGGGECKSMVWFRPQTLTDLEHSWTSNTHGQASC